MLVSVSEKEIAKKAKWLKPIPEKIPALLRDKKSWMCWKAEHRKGEPKPTKIPFDCIHGGKAATDDPGTWCDFSWAVKTFRERPALDGIGIRLIDDLVGVDLDHCRHAGSGVIEPWANDIISKMNTYSEVSPSGTGIRMYVRGIKPGKRNRKGSVEIYDQHSPRYLTMTGHHIEGTPEHVAEDRADALAWLCQTYLAEEEKPQHEPRSIANGTAEDVEIVELAKRHKGERFQNLWEGKWKEIGKYPSQSEADAALVFDLAFYSSDEDQIRRLFTASGLYRDKWDRADYSGRAIGGAIAGVTDRFDWVGHKRKLDREQFALDEAKLEELGIGATADEDPTDDPIGIGVSTADVTAASLKPKSAEDEKKKPRRKAISDADVEGMPDPEWIVEGLFDIETMNSIYGETGKGKSFFAIDLANSLARGIPFWDHFPSKSLPVAYIYSEGTRGLKKRTLAWRKKRNHKASQNLCYLPFRFSLDDGDEVAEVVKLATDVLGRPPAVLIVDTLARNFSGDENASKDMGKLVAQLTDLMTFDHITIFLIHHTGKDLTRGARGSVVLKCSVESEIEIAEKGEDTLIVSTGKVKDGPNSGPFLLHKNEVIISPGYTSLTLEWAGTFAEDYAKEATEKQDHIEGQILKVLSGEKMTARQIQELTGITSKATLHRVLSDMREHAEIAWEKTKHSNGFECIVYWRLGG